MSTSWDNARRHARALETALDAKLSTYSKIASTITRGGGGGASSSSSREAELEDGAGGYKLVEEEIDELISKVSHQTSVTVTERRVRVGLIGSSNKLLMI
jgi:Golgi SNAP receptor complex protein 1